MPDDARWARISIVTPSYNQGQPIEETIRSVLLQGYPNLEYIIIDGGRTDGTLQTLRDFQAKEDTEDKLTVVTAQDERHPDGFWPGEKDEQSQAYALRATGDYLWQVDVDEFYRREDMHSIVRMLYDDPEITAVSFSLISFWGGLDVTVDTWHLHRGWAASGMHRLFRWGPGYRYVTHRPPTVCDPEGRATRSLKWITGSQLARRGIYLYHYPLVFPKQVIDKCSYYDMVSWGNRDGSSDWARRTCLNLQKKAVPRASQCESLS
jgi:glycosyltransferase involved in cell wall biosynthesis